MTRIAPASTSGAVLPRTAVVVMAYGTPASPADVEAYYTHVRRGRPPTAEQLADLQRRYDAIGGVSPLRERTEAQAAAIGAALDAIAPGAYRVVLGMKHTAPYIEDAVAGAAGAAGSTIERVVGLVLAPHYSALSVGEYHERLRATAADHGLAAATVDDWHLLPPYLDFLAHTVTERLTTLPASTQVVFTAHSLPSRILATGDPYPAQLEATAAAVAGRVGLGAAQRWAVAWQSAGRTPEPWLGPDVLTLIDELADGGRHDGILVCPAGFVADHLEVLYDLDIEARARAEARGLAFARTASLNDDPAVMRGLAELVVAAGATIDTGALTP